MARKLLIALGLVLACALTGSQLALADEPAPETSAKKPPYERLLQGEDAEKAAELQERIEKLEADDDYAGAIRAAKELFALRAAKQGADHWETINQTHELTALEKLAALPAERRRDWRTAERGAIEAKSLESKGRYAPAL